MGQREILSRIKERLTADIDRYLAGDKAAYLYKCRHTERYGDTDENRIARLRLVYGLQFGVRELPENEREQMVRELFEQEVKACENESFQGFGAGMEMLADMMQKYRTSADEELFTRAKNANFDCWCGLMTDGGYNYPASTDGYDIADSIYLAAELEMTEEVCALVDIFKGNGLEGEDFEKLRRFAKYTHRKEDREQAVRGCYERAFESEITDENGKMRALTAAEDMIGLLAEKGEVSAAEELFKKHTDVLTSANRRAFYTCALCIMQADESTRKRIWKYVKKNIRHSVRVGEFYSVCYGDIKNCAEIAGDGRYVRLMEMLMKKKG